MSSPKHLSAAARALYGAVVKRYEMEAHHLAVLTKALEAFDRSEAARVVIERDGVLTVSRLGEVKAHPAVGIERDARAAFLAGIKQLNLDLEPPPAARRR